MAAKKRLRGGQTALQEKVFYSINTHEQPEKNMSLSIIVSEIQEKYAPPPDLLRCEMGPDLKGLK